MKKLLCSLFALSLVWVPLARSAPALPPVPPWTESRLPTTSKYLTPGGDCYVCLDSSQWAAKLEKFLTRMEAVVEDTLGEKEPNATLTFHLVKRLLAESGLQELGGVGMSSVSMGKGLHQNRLFLQHAPDGPKGLLWETLTADNGALDFLQCLPADTAFARWEVVRPQPLWKWIGETVQSSGDPELVRLLERGLAKLGKAGIEPDRLLESLTGGVGVVATLNPERKVTIRTDSFTACQIPAFEAALVLEVKDDTLFDLIRANLTLERGEPARVEQGGIRATVLREEELGESGIAIRSTLARFGRYLVLSSSDRLVESLAARSGGLVANPDFQRLRQSVPEEGFAFLYTSPQASMAIADLLFMAYYDGYSVAPLALADACGPLRNVSCWSVSLRTPDGVAVVANQTGGIEQLFLVHGAVAVAAARSVTLPIFPHTRGKGRRDADQYNLRQIGLAEMMYAADHEEKLPDDLGQVMDEYLAGGRCLVCPVSGTPVPTTPDQVRAGRCDYLYFGKGMTDADRRREIPLACTKPGLFASGYVSVLFADGHVEGFEKMPPEVGRRVEAARRE